MQHSVLAGGPSVWAEDLPLAIERGTGPEQAYFTFSYSHVPDASGPGGVLAVLSMTTDKVVAARRLGILNDLAGVGNQSPDPETAVAGVLRALEDASEDIQGGAVYRPADLDVLELPLARGGSFGSFCGDLVPDVVNTADDPVTRAWSSGRPVLEGGDDGGERTARVPARAHGRRDGCGAGALPASPAPLRRGPRAVRRPGGRPGRPDPRRRHRTRTRAVPARGTGGPGRREDRVPVQRQPRVPYAADAAAGPAGGRARPGVPRASTTEDLTEMHSSAHRLLRMVNGLLDVARIEADGLHATPEPADLAELTRDLLQPFASAAARANVALEHRLDPALGVVTGRPGAVGEDRPQPGRQRAQVHPRGNHRGLPRRLGR